jgi:hypothetical protein
MDGTNIMPIHGNRSFGLYSTSSVVANGLVLYLDAADARSYPGSGTTWNDLSGNSINATLSNVSYDSSNQGSLSFNGSSSLATMSNSTLLNNQSFTIESWIKTNNTNQNGFWFEKGTVNTQYSLFQEGNNIVCRINNGSTLVNTIVITTANFINTSSWYQVVFTFTSGSQFCYINAVQVGTGTTSATVATNNNGMSVGVYGGESGARGYYYNGNISITRIYNRALNATEVQQNFNAFRGRYGI